MQRIIELFKNKEPKPFWYINPWGFTGGLFGSATIVLSLVTAYESALFGDNYIIFISVLIFLWGYMHSKTISQSNDMWGEREYMMALMEAQNGLIKVAKLRMETDDEIIDQQKRKITLLESRVKELTHE